MAFALFFNNLSTFLGKANLYPEDLFVKEEYRGPMLGRALFACLAKIAIERGCGRLDWNGSTVAFYKHMGAKPMADWTCTGWMGRT